MTLPALEAVAQVAVGRVLNSLPESLLIVLSAALLLRLIGRRNSGTRFAVWMVAFVAVAGLPFVGLRQAAEGAGFAAPSFHPEITIPTFWAEAFLCVWIPLSLLALARVVAGLARVRRIRAASVEVDLDQADPILRTTMQQHAAGRPVCLATSDQVRVPTAIGFRCPAVVLPPWVLRDLSAEQLRPILIHELAHLSRRDDWTNLLQKTVRALFCFHPAVWWIDSRLSKERELACDDAVLVATADPRAYASSLLGLLEKSGFRRGWTMAQAAIGRACEATQRITRILSGGRPAGTRASRSALGLAAMLSAASCGLLVAAPRLVVFGPEQPTAAVQAQRMPRIEPVSAPLVSTHEAAGTARNVVAAAWHPAPAATRKLVFRAEAKSHRKAANRMIADRKAQPAAPRVELASARVQQPRPVPMLLVFETTATRVTPAVQPSAPATQPRVTDAGALANGQPAPGAAVGSRPLQIETVQFIEQQDASGVHIQIIHLLFTALAPNSGAQPGSISASI